MASPPLILARTVPLVLLVALTGPLRSQVSPVRVAGGDFVELTRARYQANATAGIPLRPVTPPRGPIHEKVADYATEVIRTHDLVESLAKLTPAELNGQVEIGIALYSQSFALDTANASLLEAFAETRIGLMIAESPEVFLARHDEAVEEHSLSHQALLDLLAALRQQFGDPIARHQAVADIAHWFSTRPARLQTPLNQDDPTNREPIENRLELAEIGLGKNGIPQPAASPVKVSKDPPADADLDPSLETPFAPELVALAEELDHSPLKIFNYVRENILFDPYRGSRRGAVETLRLRAGNDMDQASLLIALLRISEIPARYATGLVKMSPEAANNWLGLNDAATAGSLLATAGLEGTNVYDGSEIAYIRLRRVWVEAYLPFSDYRGTGPVAGEPLWVSLDPAFKSYDNTIGVDPLSGSPAFDIDQVVLDYFLNLEVETFQTIYGQQLDARLKAIDGSLSLETNALSRQINATPLPVLPAGLPNTALTRDSVFSTVPDTERYKIRFLISGGGATLDHSVFLPAIAGKQLTLSYIGATTADQNAITANGGLFGIASPWTIKVRPQLRLDGCVIATASGSVTLGVIQSSQFTFTPPDQPAATIDNTITAGVYEGLAIGTGRSVAELSEPDLACTEDNTGRFLHLLGTQYLQLNDEADRRVASWMQGAVWKGVTNAILGQQVRVAYSGGTPLTFDYSGVFVDADRAGASFFSAYGENRSYAFGRARGTQSSQNENLVFEINLGKESVSTIKILSLAAANNIPIYQITPANAGTYLPLLNQSTQVYNNIVAELNQGKHVTIPRDPFVYFDWAGTGYIHLDPTNGTGGYIIAGGISGGATAEDEDDDPGCDKVDRIEIDPPAPGNIYSACQTTPITIKAFLTTFDSECNATGAPIRTQIVDPQSIAPGTHTFKFGSPGDCGCGLESVDITIKESPVEFKDSDGRIARGGLLEIAASGSEDITCEVKDGPPSVTWLGSNGATPPSVMGNPATLNVDIPNNVSALPNALLPVPAIGFMLFPPDPANIEATGLAETCGTQAEIWPFPANAFELSLALGQPSDEAVNNRSALGKFNEALANVEKIEDTLDAFSELAKKLQAPVSPPDVDFSAKISVKDGIGEDSASNRIIYKVDLGVEGEAGIMGEIPVVGAYLVAVPPSLLNVTVFIPVKAVVGARLSGVAEYRRDIGFVNAIYPQAEIFAAGTIGIGVQASIASGAVSLTGQGTTTLKLRTIIVPTVAGKSLSLDGDLQAEVGGLKFEYKVGAVYGLWESAGSWDVLPPVKVPTDPIPYNIFKVTLP